MFDSTKKDLKDILREADEGRLQLPDFQRSYVWGDDDVRSLIASIAKGFPVGALLTLEAGSEVRFKPRLLEGVPGQVVEPDELLLDGQQRVTSLYQSLFAKAPVRTRIRSTTEVEHFYYLDIKKSIDAGADLIDAIVAVPANRTIRTNFGKDIQLDLSTPQHEFEQDMFPLNQTFDSRRWFFAWRNHWLAKGRDVNDLEQVFENSVLDRVVRYKMPIIRLDKRNSREGICLVFEKVNVGGKKLDAFELLTAIYAGEKCDPPFDLRAAWNGVEKKEPGIKKRLIGTDYPRLVLDSIQSTDYLQACTLLHTREERLRRQAEGARGNELPQISCNRPALLSLPLSAFRKHAAAIEAGFIDAAEFLNEQKIISAKDVPYPPQIVALAALFAILRRQAHTVPAREKIARWFWCAALGELYGSSTETRMARDLPAFIEWIVAENASPPPSVTSAIFQQHRLRELRGRISAAYKAIHALLMHLGCRDFIRGDAVELMTFFQRKIDVHHIFPQKWCKDRGIDRREFDSIVNKTPLSKQSNIAIGGDAPSVYLERIQRQTGVSAEALDEILRTHLIEPKLLRADDFKGFFQARLTAISDRIGQVMDKPVVVNAATNEIETDVYIDEHDENEEPESGDEE